MVDLQTRMMRSRIFIFIAGLQLVPFGIPYRLTCPQQSHWNILSKHMCPHAQNYTCLLNILTLEYQQKCKGPRKIAPGSKYVWQPINFNRAECDAERYQPFIFRTEGNTNCLYSKSRCYSEGQATFGNGSAKNDRSCYCDNIRGYVFVSSIHEKFCIPSEEDCSCHKDVTKGVTNIYNTGHNSVDYTTYHLGVHVQSSVVQSVNTVTDYDDITYNIKRNASAVIISNVSERLRMTTCMQCHKDATTNRTIEDEQNDIESGTSNVMRTDQNVLTDLDKCVLHIYISNHNNEEIFRFASILRQKGLISKREYSYIVSCYKHHNYHNMRSAAIRHFTDIHTDLRNIVMIMYNIDNKNKSCAIQLYTTYKNVLELSPVIVSRIEIQDLKYIQKCYADMKKKVQEMQFKNPVEDLTNLLHHLQKTGQRCDQTQKRVNTKFWDKCIVLVAVTIDALANETNNIDPNGKLFNEIEAIVSKSSCPDLSQFMLYGRKTVAFSFQNKREEGEDMERNALICAANIEPCILTVDMYYKIVLFHRWWYEINPQKELIFIAGIKEKAFDILKAMEDDEVKLFWARRFAIRLLLCYLGLGKRCSFIKGYTIRPEYVEKSRELLKLFDSSAEIRIRMFFYIAYARLFHLTGDIRKAIFYNDKAEKIAKKGNYNELEIIIDNREILRKSWSLPADLL